MLRVAHAIYSAREHGIHTIRDHPGLPIQGQPLYRPGRSRVTLEP
jgi:hypothetical protein